jgi:RNA polymerase sigma-70 factor (ECF subfamily)
MGGRAAPLVMSIRERILIRRLRERDERAFGEMVRLYQHKIYNLALRMVGDREEAKEVAQEVFVTVFKHIDTFRGEAKFSTWIYRIATNHTRNRMKYLGRRAHNHTAALDDAAERELMSAQPSPMQPRIAGPDAVLEGHELERIVQEGLSALDEDQREALVLREVESLSYEEIAAITGVAVGTVKSRIHRARLQLKERMTRHLGVE